MDTECTNITFRYVRVNDHLATVRPMKLNTNFVVDATGGSNLVPFQEWQHSPDESIQCNGTSSTREPRIRTRVRRPLPIKYHRVLSISKLADFIFSTLGCLESLYFTKSVLFTLDFRKSIAKDGSLSLLRCVP